MELKFNNDRQDLMQTIEGVNVDELNKKSRELAITINELNKAGIFNDVITQKVMQRISDSFTHEELVTISCIYLFTAFGMIN